VRLLRPVLPSLHSSPFIFFVSLVDCTSALHDLSTQA
jgi:hypothetical protein